MSGEGVDPDAVRQVFREALSIEPPADDLDLIEAGLLDSLGLVELLFRLEQRFGVDLARDELDVESFRTLRRIADFVGRRAQAPSS